MLPGCERTSSSPMMERFLLLSSEMYSSNSWLISESQESHQRVLFWGTSWYIIGFLDTLPQPRHLISMKILFSTGIAHNFQNAQVAINKKCTQFLTLFWHMSSCPVAEWDTFLESARCDTFFGVLHLKNGNKSYRLAVEEFQPMRIFFQG